MATINRNCLVLKAIVCVDLVIFNKTSRFLIQYQLFWSYVGLVKALNNFDNKLFLDNYILHAKYRKFSIISTHLNSRPYL